MRTRCILTLILTVAFYHTLGAQWRQTNGPFGGSVRSFVVSGTNVFAGINGGVFLSANCGTIWAPVILGLTLTGPDALAVSGTNLFAGDYGAGVFVSTNGGTSWKEVNAGLTNKQVLCLAPSGTDLFAGTRRGVFLSADSGSSWIGASTGLPKDSYGSLPYVCALAVSGTNFFAGTSAGVFLSTDNGASWTGASAGLPYNPYGSIRIVNAFAVMPDSGWAGGTHVFAGTSGGGVFVSTDGDTNWTGVNSGLTDSTVHAFAVSGKNLYAGTSGGVFLSTDKGANWTPTNAGLTEKAVYSLAATGACLFAGTENGLFCSTDGAKTWTDAPVILTSVECFASDDSRLFTGVARNRIFLSTDGGTNWLLRGNLTADYHMYCMAIAGSNLLAGGTCTVGRVDISTDAGLSWRAALDTLVQPPFTGRFNAEAFLVRGPAVFAAGNGIWASSDNGNSWSSRNEGITSSPYFYSLAIFDTNLFAAPSSSQGGIFVSHVSGGPWRTVGTGMAGAYLKNLIVSGTNMFAGTMNKGVFRSTDRGVTWTPTVNGLEDSVIYGMATSGTKIFAGTSHRGVFLSIDNGASWTAVNEGLKTQNVNALEVFGTELYAGTAGLGVWRRPLSELVVPVDGAGVTENPHDYRLSQNYPNPFNPGTTIKLELPKASEVRLIVFDMLGREVGVLINERRDAGVHEVKFDGSGLASGVYFYRLQAGDFVAMKKLLLLR